MIYDRERSEGYETLRRASPAIVQVLAAAMGVGVPGGAMRVLDAGCGSGNYLYEFAGRAHLGLRLFGLDISPDMLEHARRKTTGFRVGLACADLERLPLAAGAFDAVYMVHALHHLGGDPELPPPRREIRRRAALAELHRVLSAGGRLCIVQSDPWQNQANCLWSRYFPQALERKLSLQPESGQVAAWLRAAGFVDVEVRAFEDWLTRPVFNLQFVLDDRFLPVYSEFSYLTPMELAQGRSFLAADIESGRLSQLVRESYARYMAGGGNVTAITARRAP